MFHRRPVLEPGLSPNRLAAVRATRAVISAVAVLTVCAATVAMPSPARAKDRSSCDGASSWQVALETGRGAFARRAEQAVGVQALAGPVSLAVDCFRHAVRLAPERFEPRVELLRAMFFQGEYAARSDAERKNIFLEGRDFFEQSLDLLSKDLGVDLRELPPEDVARVLDRRPEARPMFFFGAMHWGLWADYFGTVAALRSGVAKKLRHLGEVSLALTPQIDSAGGHRLVGQLHAKVPRLVFVSMWIDRERGLRELERAALLGPENPLNLTFLAEALADLGRDRERASELLAQVLRREPRPDHLVEDRKAIQRARNVQRNYGLERATTNERAGR